MYASLHIYITLDEKKNKKIKKITREVFSVEVHLEIEQL